MPTAAKLISALLFAGIFWVCGGLYVAHDPQGIVLNGLPAKAALVGAICGWWVLGNDVGRGYVMVFSTSIRAMVAGVFWALLSNGIIIMFDRAFQRQYRTMLDAIEGVFGLMLQYGAPVFEPDVIGTLVLGACLAGICAEWASKRWS